MGNYTLIKNPTQLQISELEDIMNPLIQSDAVSTLLKIESCLRSIVNAELIKEESDDFDMNPDIICRNMMLKSILSAIAKTCDMVEGNSDIIDLVTGGKDFVNPKFDTSNLKAVSP